MIARTQAQNINLHSNIDCTYTTVNISALLTGMKVYISPTIQSLTLSTDL